MNNRIAVHLHLYYEDLLDEFVDYLNNIKIPFDLFVTIVNESDELIGKLKRAFPDIKILQVKNKGKDIGGFLEALKVFNLDEYDLVLKIHTKKSLHDKKYFNLINSNLRLDIYDGDTWRHELLDAIVGSPKVVDDIVSIFMNRPDVGLFGNEKYLSFDRDVNEELYEKLCDELGVENRSIFIAGTMFWIRGSLLKLLKVRTISSCFNIGDCVESGLEHCYERIFGAIVYESGMKIYTQNDNVEEKLFKWMKVYQTGLRRSNFENTVIRNSLSYRIGRIITSPLWISLRIIKILYRFIEKCFYHKIIFLIKVFIDWVLLKKILLKYCFMKFEIKSDKKIILIISHTNYKKKLGGTEKYINEQSEDLSAKGFDVVHLFPLERKYCFNDKKEMKYGVNFNGKLLAYTDINNIKEELLKDSICVQSIIIHHLMFWQFCDVDSIISIADKKNTDLTYYAHDFLCCCPSTHLMYKNNTEYVSCVAGETKDCSKCDYGENLSEWRVYFSGLFMSVKKIIVPSEFVAKTISNYYYDVKDKTYVRPHLNFKEREFSALENELSNKRKIRLAYLGYRAHNKGWKTWEKIYNSLYLRQYYDLYHIGSNDHYSYSVKSVPYSFANGGIMSAVNALEKNGIDIVILWSIVPESYSYTLFESVAAGIPVITNTMSGNIYETVRSNGESIGVICNDDKKLFEFLSNIDEVKKVIDYPRKKYTLSFNSDENL